MIDNNIQSLNDRLRSVIVLLLLCLRVNNNKITLPLTCSDVPLPGIVSLIVLISGVNRPPHTRRGALILHHACTVAKASMAIGVDHDIDP